MAVLETPRRTPLTERIAAHREGDALLGRLALLGWKVVVDRHNDLFVGVARPIGNEGRTVAVSAVATTRVDVLRTLLERAASRRAVTAAS